MEFKKENVYTAVNADELRAGDKVITARCMADLKTRVEADAEPNVIELIQDETNTDRFTCKCFNSDKTYDTPLAYLVERAQSCKNCIKLCRGKEGDNAVCEDWEGDEPKTEQKVPDCPTCKNREECDFVLGKNSDRTGCEEWEAEPHYRPFKDTDELVKVWQDKTFNKTGLEFYDYGLTMPLIWVRSKGADIKSLIIGFKQIEDCNAEVFMANGQTINTIDLYAHWTFLDGSPCGVTK